MKSLITPVTLVSTCAITAFVLFSGIDGKWKGYFKGADGQSVPIGYDFKTDGDKLTGVAHAGDGDHDILDGKIKGDSLFFKMTVEDGDITTKGKYFATSDSMHILYNFFGRNAQGYLKRAANR